MNDFFKKLTADLSAFFQKMSVNQRLIVLSVVIIVIIGFIFLINWIRQPQLVVLYSNLDPESAGEIVDKLKERNSQYRLTRNGTTIEVPSRYVYDLRIELAKDGLPRKSETGYELFDQNKLGMSDFMQKLSYRRAIEGELIRTIQEMHEVEQARVHIVIPEPSLFEEDKKEPTASILLKLRPSAGLTRDQIRGIAHLVSGSVEGLRPENVNIVDFYGNILSDQSGKDSFLGLSTSQLELKKKVDGYLVFKIQSLFDNVLGPNNSYVRVDADLDFRQVEKTNEIYDPENTSVRSEEIQSETSPNGNNQTAETEHTTTNYEINKTIEHVLETAGNINRLSIAIFVDGIYKEEKDKKGNIISRDYQPRSQQELDQLANIAKNVVGFDDQRNDQIIVQNIAFDRSHFENEQRDLKEYEKKQFIMSIVQKVVLGLVILIFLLYLRSFVRRFIKRSPAAERAALDLPAKEAEILEGMKSISEELNEREPKQVKQQTERIKTFTQAQPEEVSKLIRTWLEEDETI